jgi:hypothetical protein
VPSRPPATRSLRIRPGRISRARAVACPALEALDRSNAVRRTWDAERRRVVRIESVRRRSGGSDDDSGGSGGNSNQNGGDDGEGSADSGSGGHGNSDR